MIMGWHEETRRGNHSRIKRNDVEFGDEDPFIESYRGDGPWSFTSGSEAL